MFYPNLKSFVWRRNAGAHPDELLHGGRKPTGTSVTEFHRRTGRGGRGGAAAPPNFGQLRFFGQGEKIWAKPAFKDVSILFYYFKVLNINLKSA